MLEHLLLLYLLLNLCDLLWPDFKIVYWGAFTVLQDTVKFQDTETCCFTNGRQILKLSPAHQIRAWVELSAVAMAIVTFCMRYNTSGKGNRIWVCKLKTHKLHTADSTHSRNRRGKRSIIRLSKMICLESLHSRAHCKPTSGPHWLLLLPLLLLLQRSPGPPLEAGGCTLSARLWACSRNRSLSTLSSLLSNLILASSLSFSSFSSLTRCWVSCAFCLLRMRLFFTARLLRSLRWRYSSLFLSEEDFFILLGGMALPPPPGFTGTNWGTCQN